MEKFFQFKSEIGWSELISVLAAIVALWALNQSYKANSPLINISALPPRAHHVCNDAMKEWNVVAIVPFRITNMGGRATTLTGFHRDGEISPFIAISDENENLDAWNYLVIPDSIESHPKGIDAPSWDVKKILDESKVLQLDVDRIRYAHPTIFEVNIPSGETVVMNLGLKTVISTPDNKTLRRYIIRLSAEFSDGDKIPIQSVVERPFVGRYLPPCR